VKLPTVAPEPLVFRYLFAFNANAVYHVLMAREIQLELLGKSDILLSTLPSVGGGVGNQILIRDVPPGVRSWIESERRAQKMSQKEFVLAALERAREGGQPTLFDTAPARPQPITESVPFTFIDLFAGIGGLRIGFQRAGGKCVFTSEWDENAQKTYLKWFGDEPHGDIKKIKPKDIPSHDVLVAGFPCQPFSIAGVSKKNSLGRAHGFKCLTQGTLFFDVINIVEMKRPPVVVLENVKNLRSHDQGRTWNVIKSNLEEQEYWVFDEVLDASDFGVPQHRERVFIVCFDKKLFAARPDFKFPEPLSARAKLRDILDPSPSERYTLTEHLWEYLQAYAKRHAEKGNGFGFGLANLDGITRTLSARYYKDGSEILIPQSGKSPRRLSPREAGRLMGFDADVASFLGFKDELPIVVSDTQAYRQFGNAVVPAVSTAVARQVAGVLYQHFIASGRCLLKEAVAAAG
jgi:DNA (cytosine-5)-methyltransferase 1